MMMRMHAITLIVPLVQMLLRRRRETLFSISFVRAVIVGYVDGSYVCCSSSEDCLCQHLLASEQLLLLMTLKRLE